MSEPYIQLCNLTKEEFGVLMTNSMVVAIRESRNIEVQKAIEFSTQELPEALSVTRQSIHSWLNKYFIKPTRTKGIKEFYSEESIRTMLNLFSRTKREKHEAALNTYITKKYKIIIK